MKEILFALAIVFILTSCSQNLFNFTLISTKNIEIEKLSSLKKSAEKAKGEDKAHIIVIIPSKIVKIDQAITDTIDKIPGCIALVDGVVTSKFWFIPYIYGQQRIVIEATPLIDTSFVKSSKLTKYGKIFLNKKGEIKSFQTLSEGEFLNQKNKLKIQ